MAWLPTRHHEEFFTSHLDQDILHSSTFSYRYGHFWLKKKTNKTAMAVMPNSHNNPHQ